MSTEEGKIQKAETIANKKEYEERKKIKPDLKGEFPMIISHICEKENSCELKIEAFLSGKNENIPNVKQILKDALIEHFEDLIKSKENFMFDNTFYKSKDEPKIDEIRIDRVQFKID